MKIQRPIAKAGKYKFSSANSSKSLGSPYAPPPDVAADGYHMYRVNTSKFDTPGCIADFTNDCSDIRKTSIGKSFLSAF